MHISLPIKKLSLFLVGSSPKLSSLNLTTPQLLPSIMSLLNNLPSTLGIQPLLIKSKPIQRLIIGSLVPTEPFPNSILDSIGHIINIIVFLGKFIISRNGNHLPVQFPIINHGNHTKRLDLRDGSHGNSLGSNLDNINGIIIPEALELRVFLVGVLPSLGDASVVPEDGAVVIAKLSLFHVLRDGVVGFLGGYLHLGLGHFGNFNDGVVGALGISLEGDVVPGGNGGVTLGEGKAEGFRGGFSGGFGGVPVEDGGGYGTDGADGGGAPCCGGGGECQDGKGGGCELHGRANR
mmetsp:Transcript_10796/g.16458  ORF Transcript_10796/g.16458 Transcript_10796/m.16458 type:complete len:292 (+) Transcript_10796:96-971(+)